MSGRSLGLTDPLFPVQNLIFKAGKSRFACWNVPIVGAGFFWAKIDQVVVMNSSELRG